MAWFEYDGVTSGGTAIAGRIEASSLQRAADELALLQVEVRELVHAGPLQRKASGVSTDDFIFLNEQLASLAQAGIALDEGLAQLARDIGSPRLRRWIEAIVGDLRRGVPIDQAIAVREAGLPVLYSRVVRAGIQSGELPATLLNLNQHLRMAGELRRTLWELVSYPLLVAVFAVGVVSLFVFLVVPHFREIIADWGTGLPGATVLTLRLADLFPVIMLGSGGVLLAAAAAWHLLRRTPAGLNLREQFVLRIPMIGRVHRSSVLARFLRAVSTAIATGIPLPQAMRLSAQATGSELLTRDAEHLALEVESGQSIFVASQSTTIIPPLFGFCAQVAVGREALPTAIAQLAHSYENRAIHTQALLRATLFPVLIVFLGGILLFGVTAMFLPLIHLINAVSAGA